VTPATGIRKSSQIGGDLGSHAALIAVIGIFRLLGAPFHRYVSDASRKYLTAP